MAVIELDELTLSETIKRPIKRHLDRYLAEFDFRQNTRAKLGIDDTERTRLAIHGMVGRRLTYLDSSAW